MTPTPVVIVRPGMKPRELVIHLVSLVLATALRAWIVMLAAPVIDWHPGYRQTLLLVVGVWCLLPSHDDYKLWTREANRNA